MTQHAAEKARVVVCAVDCATVHRNAVEVSAGLALVLRAQLALVAVAPAASLDTLDVGLPGGTPNEARRVLELTAEALDHPFGVDCYLDSGNPVQRLAEFAARKRALLLVIGTHDRLSQRPASIVAGGLSRSAPCPLVVVPDGIAVSELGWPEADD